MDPIKSLEKYKVRVFKNARETGRQLGIGSYGSVVELKVRGVGTFAGKKLHEALINSGDTTRLVQECVLMSKLRHPNIAKFCGVCKLPTSSVPALVMELMDHNLEKVIENTADLPLTTKISILIDIAYGLAYLHSQNPKVLHRDLTARNVLLDKSMKAKITDFGNSRIVDATRISKPLTQYPGTLLYMPPEAFNVHSKYGDRLDIFSFGHLGLYTITQTFPKNLLPATYTTEDEQLAARSEVERRSEYIELLHKSLPTADHPMARLVKQCLHNDPNRRPDCLELLHWLEDIQSLDQGEPEMEDECAYVEMDEIKRSSSITESEKMSSRVAKIQRFETAINSRTDKDNEFLDSGSTRHNKTGLLEKKSKQRKGGWKAYSFTIDRSKETLQYMRPGVFAKNPKISLADIRDVEGKQSDGTRFPFSIYFDGRDSPWELNVYSEAERNDWKASLMQKCEAIKTRPCEAYELVLPKKDDDETEEIGENVYTPEPSKNMPPSSMSPGPNPPVTSPSNPSQNPNYVNIPPKLPSDTPGIDDDDAYESVIEYLQGKLNPNQMDAIAIMLQAVRASTQPEGTPPIVRNTAALQSPSFPPPSYPPPSTPPPNPKQDLNVDIYPDVVDAESSDDDESGKKAYTDAFTPFPIPQTQHTGNQSPAAAQKKKPVPRKPRPRRELNPSKSKEDLRAFSKLVRDKGVLADETLLITADDYELSERRPTWAIAKQDTLPLSVTSLEALHKKALYISESTLSGITRIGEGKFGEVYSAKMRSKIVAIKITKKFSSEKAMRDFQNEMSIMSEVVHPNIVRLYGIIREGNLSPALVMEYLLHGNLQTFLNEKRQPDLSMLKYMNDVAMGMHYLGERGLIHRDLAARNVLVDANETCKVSDFGLLREVPKDNSIYVSQDYGPSPLRWMAPESVNDRIFTPASDVWSYGILLWEMYNPDKIPYYTLEDTQMIVKVASGFRMPTPRRCAPLAAKIMRACWQKNPKQRPSFLLVSNLLTQRLIA